MTASNAIKAIGTMLRTQKKNCKETKGFLTSIISQFIFICSDIITLNTGPC